MNAGLRIIGKRLRVIFGVLAKRPMGWNLIDAFTRLEEREERLRDGEERTDAKMLRLLELNRRAL